MEDKHTVCPGYRWVLLENIASSCQILQNPAISCQISAAQTCIKSPTEKESINVNVDNTSIVDQR